MTKFTVLQFDFLQEIEFLSRSTLSYVLQFECHLKRITDRNVIKKSLREYVGYELADATSLCILMLLTEELLQLTI